jgi:hypothetical protein
MLASTVQFSKNNTTHTPNPPGRAHAGHHQENQPHTPAPPTHKNRKHQNKKGRGPVSSEPQQRARPRPSPNHPLPAPNQPPHKPKEGGTASRTHKQPRPNPNRIASAPQPTEQPTHRHTPARQATPPPQTPPQKGATRKWRDHMLLRKEVIQPHLPVRLPCYDFVLIAGPTFDHSPPTSGLGHGLRVLPTFMT